MVRPAIYTILLRLVLGAVFLWAGAAKIPDPGLFAQTIRSYEALPLLIIHPAAIVLPWIEALVGLLLIAGIWVRSSAWVALLLLFAFVAALSVGIYLKGNFDCGCFGPGGAGGSAISALVKNALLIGCAVLLLRFRQALEAKG